MKLAQLKNESKSAVPASKADSPAAKSLSYWSDPATQKAEDREFLPSALEILDTPPSPVAKSMLLSICALFLIALGWSYFGSIDIYAVAPGKIQPSGRSKVVQPVDLGKVIGIHVENGTYVNAGDVLLELDPTESNADLEAQTRDLAAAMAEAVRRKAAIAAARTEILEAPPIKLPAFVGEAVRDRENTVLTADLAQLRANISSLKSQLAEKVASSARLTSTIAAREKLIGLAKERIEMRQRLEAVGAGSRALIIEALQQYETEITTDTGDRGQLVEVDAAMRSVNHKIVETIAQFIADQSQKLALAENKRDHLEQELIKAQSKADHTELKAPISGTVQQLSVTTLGQVVGSGQSVLTIVPVGGPIEVEALIRNRDIGFVKVGQPVVVKVDAFPFTRYGTIAGTVAKVSRDAIDERDATELSDAVNAAKARQAPPQSTPRTQDLVFPATIRLAERSVNIDGKDVALMPGMAVTVEIKTGHRRVIDYLLAPLREVTSEAAHER